MADNRFPSADGISSPLPGQPNDGVPRLSLRGISKSFGAVRALTDVDFEVYAGEVVGLDLPRPGFHGRSIKVLHRSQNWQSLSRLAFRHDTVSRHLSRSSLNPLYLYLP